jgi:PBP1b-binding outer membrane lipoprotein LpoB
MRVMLTSSVLSLAFLIGCTPAHRIETGGPESITTTSQIDIQDVQDASASMIESLLRNGVFQQFAAANGRSPILLFKDGSIINDTTTRLPMPMLTGDIKAELVNSKLVQLATTYAGVSGRAQDRDAAAHARRKALRSQATANDTTPDFSLTGTIVEHSSRAGSTHQLDVQFQLTLTNWSNNVSEWTDTKKVSKQGDKPSVGL